MEPPDPARLDAARADYANFIGTYLPEWAPVPCADFHLSAAQAVAADPQYRGMWQWFRGAAKSTHAALLLPLWLAVQDPPELRFLLLVGRSQAAARRLVADLRRALEAADTLLLDTGWQRTKRWSRDELVLEGGPAFAALGLGQSPRGLRIGQQRPDAIVCDDLDYPALVRSPERVRQTVAWVLEDLLGTQDVGPSRFLWVGNLFSQRSVQAELLATGRFACHRVDALTPQGLATWPAKYGAGDWLRERQALIGYRAFAREYQNTPIEDGGAFRAQWIRYTPARPYPDYHALVAYIDPSFTATPRSDYKACKLWGAYRTPAGATEYHHLAAFVRQCPAEELFRWCLARYGEIAAAGGAVQFWIEGGFFQAVLLQSLQAVEAELDQRLPIRQDTRAKGPKYSRIEALSGLWERGLVAYAEGQQADPDTQTGIDQLLALAPGSRAHDDGPDADAGALTLLLSMQPPATPNRLVVGPRPPRQW